MTRTDQVSPAADLRRTLAAMSRVSGVGAVTLAAALVLAACGSAEGATAPVDTVRAGSPVLTPTGGTDRRAEATRANPLRVLVVGDSIASEIEAALGAAIARGPAAAVDFVPSAALPQGNLLGLWPLRLEASQPDLVLVTVGVWERFSYGPDSELGGSQSDYLEQVVRPFVEAVGAGGAEVIFVGYAPLAGNTDSAVVAEIQAGFDAFAAATAGVAFVQADAGLRSPSGAAAEIVGRSEGDPVRVRRIDGTHLCPNGAARVVEVVLDRIAVKRQVSVAEGWPGGGWRDRAPFDDPDECPPAS